MELQFLNNNFHILSIVITIAMKYSFFLDGYAPFLSMTIRDSFLNVPDHVIAAPGPGHYDVNSSSKVKGGSTVGNRGNRFESDQTFVPGPGSYNVTKYNEMGKTEPNLGFSIKEVMYFKS